MVLNMNNLFWIVFAIVVYNVLISKEPFEQKDQILDQVKRARDSKMTYTQFKGELRKLGIKDVPSPKEFIELLAQVNKGN